MKLYLAGKITGDPNYKAKFAEAAKALRSAGYSVMNPAELPDGFDYPDYMKICAAMIEVCDATCLLPDWTESDGAKFEYGHTIAVKKRVWKYEQFNPQTGGFGVGGLPIYEEDPRD